MSGLSLGLVGLPNVGKSTVFNALTRGSAQVANYPFCTIDPNVGVVAIPDERLDALAKQLKPELVTPGYLRVVDIAGLVAGAHQGEGLGNRFLAHIREVDAILHVVRCFRDPNVARAGGAEGTEAQVDPRRDVEMVEAELLLADLETVEARREKTQRAAKSGARAVLEELQVLDRLKERLESGLPARSVPGHPLSEEEARLAAELFLLTRKPVLFLANVGEESLEGSPRGSDHPLTVVEELAAQRGAEVVALAARLESELAQLDPEEARAFRDDLGLKEDVLARVLHAGMRVLNLITFYTVKGPETRAWIIPAGTPAPQAAGRIHSDMERGFIRAEVIPWDQLLEAGSFAAARAQGLVRSEGRDYIIQDGDVVLFRFNV